ncbi:carotenoid oxygenase family protein [Sphingobium nicotianae]|uniref:Dioxygenase n=1 Tax=Sphingobium nicotianae TaxID=2782607 RepID=A0A9X1D9Y8_9SPHN|nr:carotenoid oxygenase family protein [Sphingobium nicotianae]MBT2186114.1 carotenoid oxygenase family protein [Sphingobium nicotianae]
MVHKFDGPAATGFFTPQRFDAEVLDCEVDGVIPADIDGTFFRVGGEWFYPPKFADDAFLHTDGYVSSFRIRNGRVSYKGRFVRTPRFKSNLEAGRQQFGYYRNRFTDDPAVAGLDATVSNTAPLVHAGKLFTLKEDALPYQIDPVTLETIGPWNFGGAYKSQTFTAHPKIDPLTGEMITFGYEATGPASDDLFLYYVDKAGKVGREVRLKVPYVSIIHDFAVTQKHVIFPFACYTTSLERLKAGKIHWGWDKQLPSMIGILRRDGDGSDIRWFKGPERCMMHVFNAHSLGDKVILYAPFYESNFFPFFPNVDGSPWDPSKAVSHVRKLTFDLSKPGDGWEEEILFHTPISDLGKVDQRFTTLPQRYAFTNFSDPTRPFDEARAGNMRGRVSNSYGRFDLHTGALDRYFVGETHTLQECSFVPRRGSTAEGDGYLIGTASNLAEMRTELIIADAQRLSEGDIARVYLPFRAGTQVHGYWWDAEEIGTPTSQGGHSS